MLWRGRLTFAASVEIMDAGWAAVIGALIAGGVSFSTVLLSRAEPRALKELKALNALIDGSPKSSDARAALEKRRNEIAEAYAAAPASVEERAVPIMFMGGLGLLAIAFVVYLLGTVDTRTAPMLIAFLVGTLGFSLTVLSLVLGGAIVVGFATPFLFSKARQKWATRRSDQARGKPAVGTLPATPASTELA